MHWCIVCVGAFVRGCMGALGALGARVLALVHWVHLCGGFISAGVHWCIVFVCGGA